MTHLGAFHLGVFTQKMRLNSAETLAARVVGATSTSRSISFGGGGGLAAAGAAARATDVPLRTAKASAMAPSSQRGVLPVRQALPSE